MDKSAYNYRFMYRFILNNFFPGGKNNVYMAEYNGRFYIFKIGKVIVKKLKK